jgi:hypothetical protein
MADCLPAVARLGVPSEPPPLPDVQELQQDLPDWDPPQSPFPRRTGGDHAPTVPVLVPPSEQDSDAAARDREIDDDALSAKYILESLDAEKLLAYNQNQTARSSSIGQPSSFDRRSSRRRGTPKRPLSAYNLFFKALRAKLLQEESRKGGLGFAELGRQVGAAWQVLTDTDRVHYESLARGETERYRQEMHVYKANQKKLQKERQEKEWKQVTTVTFADEHSENPYAASVLSQNQSRSAMPPPSGHMSDMSHAQSQSQSSWQSQAQVQSQSSCSTNLPCPVPGASWQQAHLAHLPPPSPWTLPLPPVIRSHPSLDDLPVPAGKILHYPDPLGGHQLQSFVVQYQVYHMPAAHAQAYVDTWSAPTAEEAGLVVLFPNDL